MLIRMQFRKTREGRFLSHLDLMHTWERVIRRSRLPLAFSQGFNPHPKINFASACAVGTTSDGEYMDMELTEDMPLTQVKAALDQAMPPAFEVTALKVVQGKTPSLMSIITRARY
ncbi:MAG: TIGR03936 family radical SAM-associated protein, partial [Peptococcaceae bacterium]